jgi:hypothetical protein
VQWRFAELRAAEQMRDAQTEGMQIANESAKYAAGWTDQNEASQAITGHDAELPAPIASASPQPEIAIGAGDKGNQP